MVTEHNYGRIWSNLKVFITRFMHVFYNVVYYYFFPLFIVFLVFTLGSEDPNSFSFDVYQDMNTKNFEMKKDFDFSATYNAPQKWDEFDPTGRFADYLKMNGEEFKRAGLG